MKTMVGAFNRSRIITLLAATGIATLILFVFRPAVAEAAGVEEEAVFVFNTFAFLIWGALVMWMAAGFTMLEAGSVRTKNASMICLKNIGIYSIAGLAYFVLGYNLMYVGVGRELMLFGIDFGGLIGSFRIFYESSAEEAALLAGEAADASALLASGAGYASMSDWFFQMVFVATAASIVSGALAERVKMWSFFVFVLVLTAVIYPIIGAWYWGRRLARRHGIRRLRRFHHRAQHGRMGALAGVMIVGPRLGKFRKDGTARATPPSNILVVTLGVFILWLGWFGFNGGSQLALGSAADAISMSVVIVNTNLAAAAGVVAALLVSRPIMGRIDLFAGLNGAIAGLVAVTAAPNFVDHPWALLVGGVGGVLVVGGIKLLETLKLDDVVGAIPAHLIAGVWGTIAACITVGATFHVQLIGIVCVGAFAFGASWLLWQALARTISARVSPDVERLGQDAGELGMESYPEFVLMPEDFDED